MAKNHRYDGTITCFKGAITDFKNHGRTVWDSDLYIEDLELAIEAMENASTLTLDDLRPSGRWIDAKAQHPPLDKMVLVIVNGKPKNNITLDRAYELAEWEPEGWCLEM